MTPSERALMNELRAGANSFDSYFEDESADAPPVSIAPSSGKLAAVKGNPTFSAQFDVSVMLKYFTVTGGVYTSIAASALNAALKNQLPFYLFGNSDFASGYKSLRSAFPLTGWVHGRPGVYGKDDFSELAFDSTVTNTLILGDLVIPFTSSLPGAGTTTLGLVVVRCTQVAYGTLLDALNSDRFVMNMIRYVIPDLTKLNQYSNNVYLFNQSLFGKMNSDFLSPNSFKKPEQFQNGLIDIPLKKGIDKQTALGSYINYDCTELTWSIFVWSVRKISAQ